MIIFLSNSLRSSLSRFASSEARFLPGWIRPGALGSTASVALCAQLSLWGDTPKKRHEAASMPTTLPPKGALEAYLVMMVRLEYLSSVRRASSIS